ncbi:MAG TPA: class I SAM-dependent methyltransferase [Eubacteriaceae bacterium]|nr:class I SAM-dependent methyltransferase [Eubacteriaceae bacterium]
MTFYQEIAPYYDDIFPVRQGQIDFLEEQAAGKQASFLDVACGTAGISMALAKRGHRVTGFDNNEEMVAAGKEKCSREKLDTLSLCVGDMLDLSFLKERYDVIFSLGNSLVHLDTKKDIKRFLEEAKDRLTEDGRLVLQTINYDRIMKFQVNALPTIENEAKGVRFVRKYHYDKEIQKIRFQTVFTKEQIQRENEVCLIPLLSSQLIRMLEETGYTHIRSYGGFDGREFETDTSYPLIVTAEKGKQ